MLNACWALSLITASRYPYWYCCRLKYMPVYEPTTYKSLKCIIHTYAQHMQPLIKHYWTVKIMLHWPAYLLWHYQYACIANGQCIQWDQQVASYRLQRDIQINSCLHSDVNIPHPYSIYTTIQFIIDNNLSLFDCRHKAQSNTTNIHQAERDTQQPPRRAALYTEGLSG